jgi:hypothetical protein
LMAMSRLKKTQLTLLLPLQHGHRLSIYDNQPQRAPTFSTSILPEGIMNLPCRS